MRGDAARDLKRSFRVEIEEVERKTTSNRCGRVSHWSRECRQPRDGGKEGGKSAPSASSREAGASYAAVKAEDTPELEVTFAAMVVPCPTRLYKVRALKQAAVHDGMLVLSPGFGVLDSSSQH